MAKTSAKARQAKRERLVAKYAALRKELKEKGDYEGLQKLPRNCQPDAAAQPVQHHRKAARLHAEIRHLPHRIPRAGAGREDPGRDEGELVKPLSQFSTRRSGQA